MQKFILLFTFFLTFTTLANESSVYDFSWLDKDKEVYVLQNRKFRKNGKLYIGGTLGRSVAGAYIDSNEFNLLAGYFFKEDWGLEISYTKANGTPNKTHDAVNSQGSVAFYRKIDTALNAMIVWSPFYSKINTFNKIFYYDWLFGLGITNLTTIDNRNEFPGGEESNVKTTESNSGFTWMTGFRFFISESWSMRLDFTGKHINADSAINGETDTEKRWSHFYNINVGVNYTF